VQVADIPANTNQALAIIRGFGATLDVKFLKLELDSFVSDRVKERARGGAMANVSLGDIRSLEIVIPPLAEQRCIVAKVEQLMDLVDQLEGQLVASRAVGEKLLEAVVAELTIGTRAA
jgi:type I restriction enzyme S subunit